MFTVFLNHLIITNFKLSPQIHLTFSVGLHESGLQVAPKPNSYQPSELDTPRPGTSQEPWKVW